MLAARIASRVAVIVTLTPCACGRFTYDLSTEDGAGGRGASAGAGGAGAGGTGGVGAGGTGGSAGVGGGAGGAAGTGAAAGGGGAGAGGTGGGSGNGGSGGAGTGGGSGNGGSGGVGTGGSAGGTGGTGGATGGTGGGTGGTGGTGGAGGATGGTGGTGGITVGAPGTLDQGFGGGGVVITPIGTNNTQVEATVVQPDGRIVVGACVPGGVGDRDMLILRLNEDGSADDTFGTSGRTTIDVSLSDCVYALLLLADGHIVVGGVADLGVDTAFTLARLDAAGAIDPSFGGGIVQTALVGSSGIKDLALLSDGRLVAAGSSYDTDNDFAVAVYAQNGTLDPSFGGGAGFVTLQLPGDDQAGDAVVVQSGDRILLAGDTLVGGSRSMLFARYLADGTEDLSFGPGGAFQISIGSGDLANDLVLENGDGFAVIGSADVGGTDGYQMCLIHFSADGDVLTSNVLPGDPGIADLAWAAARQPDGRIILGGSSGTQLTLWRLTAPGGPDFQFGSNGRVQLSVGAGMAAADIALGPDGRIVVVGQVSRGGFTPPFDIGVVRLWP